MIFASLKAACDKNIGGTKGSILTKKLIPISYFITYYPKTITFDIFNTAI